MIKKLRFGKTKIVKGDLYGAKKPIEIWDVDAGNRLISKSIETKNRSDQLTGYLVLDIYKAIDFDIT